MVKDKEIFILLGRKQGEEREIVLSLGVGSGGRALKQVLEILKSKNN
ncbi:MAG: hypothetical protein SVO01_11345 [Thermotogota bacterium]|nr:hypothetical protein [Thermotogota bacterium]